jgi:hypothetical protein
VSIYSLGKRVESGRSFIRGAGSEELEKLRLQEVGSMVMERHLVEVSALNTVLVCLQIPKTSVAN